MIRPVELHEPRRSEAPPRELRVLVAVDGSQSSLEAVRRLAGMFHPEEARVRILTVLSYGLGPSAYTGTPLDDADRERRLTAGAEEAVTLARDVLEARGFEVEVTHRLGNPADGILREIEEHAPDLLVMGRRGLGVPARWLMGSVSERVLRNTHVPVLVVS